MWEPLIYSWLIRSTRDNLHLQLASEMWVGGDGGEWGGGPRCGAVLSNRALNLWDLTLSSCSVRIKLNCRTSCWCLKNCWCYGDHHPPHDEIGYRTQKSDICQILMCT